MATALHIRINIPFMHGSNSKEQKYTAVFTVRPRVFRATVQLEEKANLKTMFWWKGGEKQTSFNN